jgi:NADPH:quinone reductase-like Zn-dependent oxidoreductase
MRSYHLSKSGDGVDGLSVRVHERPAPGPGEVAVAVRAASIGFREALVLRGAYVLPVKPDGVPVAEGAGDVVAVGPGVDAVRVGDRVAATVFPTWQDGPWGLEHLPQRGGSLDGMLTEIAVVEEHGLVPIPEHLSFAEAATLPCTAVTAWNVGLRSWRRLDRNCLAGDWRCLRHGAGREPRRGGGGGGLRGRDDPPRRP